MAIWSEVTVTRVCGPASPGEWGHQPKSVPSHLCFWFFFFFFSIYIFFVGFYFIFNSLFSSRHNGTAYLWNGVIVSSLSGGCHRAVGSVWPWLYCVVKHSWHIFVWSLLVTPPNWCKKNSKKKKTKQNPHTHKNKTYKTQKKLPIFYSVSNFTSLFLIIKPENCVFLSFFPRPICWLLLFNIKSVLLFLFCFVLFLRFFFVFFF